MSPARRWASPAASTWSNPLHPAKTRLGRGRESHDWRLNIAMATSTLQSSDERRKERVRMARAAWDLARSQHGVVSSEQLRRVGYTPQAIHHRIRTGRLHPLHRGVYVVGRPHVTDHGRWMAAILACGADAVLSHSSAAAL